MEALGPSGLKIMICPWLWRGRTLSGKKDLGTAKWILARVLLWVQVDPKGITADKYVMEDEAHLWDFKHRRNSHGTLLCTRCVVGKQNPKKQLCLLSSESLCRTACVRQGRHSRDSQVLPLSSRDTVVAASCAWHFLPKTGQWAQFYMCSSEKKTIMTTYTSDAN